jgi:FSR family fosmidomycin resistance protein-like MFS transporter
MRGGIDKRAMGLLSGGHLATDLASGTLPALLPFFKERFDLSYTLTALLILASTVASSIIQPLFGHWSDQRRLLWLLPAGVGVAGLGIGIGAAMPSYWLLLVFVVISGLGIAAFHPEASKCASYASGRRRASGMSLFSVGGNIGFGLGPIVAVPLVNWLGMEGGLLIAVPTTLVAVILTRQLPRLVDLSTDVRARAVREGENNRRAMTTLLTVITLRSVSTYALITFVPLYLVEQGHSKAYASHLLAAMLLTGGVGTLLAGPLADRVGRRPVLVVSTALCAACTAVFIEVGGVVGAVALAGVGLSTIATYGVTTLMGQEYMPRNLGMASGLSIGLSIGLGGVAAVILGAVADSLDLRSALWISVAAPVVGVALALLLPAVGARRTVVAPGPAG